MAEFTRPELYAKQREALFCPERWALCEASTKSGKTVGCIAWILEQAFAGQSGMNYWWIAPVADQARIAYSRVKNGLTKGSFTALESPTPRIILMNGALIWFKSADNPDSLYGEDVYSAVIDEASRMKPDAWYAVRSTLTATGGPARIIGNVKGRKNWFYEFARRIEAGEEPNGHFSRITVVDAIEAGIIPKEEVEDAKRNLPELVFRELYMAEPSDDGGNPFGLDHIKACVSLGLAPGPVTAWGIDLAKHQDWFVCIGLNEHGQVAGFHRWRGVPWRDSIRRVWQLVGEDTPALVDSTGVGDPVLEELQHEHGNFFGYNFTQVSKQRLMEGLAVSIQSHEISYPDGVIKTELDSFEYEETRTGVRYAAAEGHHDDCVCSLALARQMLMETQPGQNVMQYYVSQTSKLKKMEDTQPKEENRPWRPLEVEISASDIIDNELTVLYNEVLSQTIAPKSLNCFACGKPVSGATRVSDGENIWHPDCAGSNQRIAA